MLALVEGVIYEGTDDIRVGYYPFKPLIPGSHCTPAPPENACWKASQPKYAALWNTPLQPKTYGNWKKIFLFNILSGLTLK